MSQRELEVLNKLFQQKGITLESELDRGGSGTVYLISGEQNGQKEVLKVVDISRLAKESASYGQYTEEQRKALLLIQYENELEINKRLTFTRCEYLVRILDSYRIGSEMDEVCLCAMRMPYYDTLASIKQVEGLSEKTVIRLGMHICEALRVLHHDIKNEYYPNETLKLGVMLHMDIKPENIFVQGSGEAQTFMLGDFGALTNKKRNVNVTNTPIYRAPELEKQPNGEKPKLTETADVFSLGMVLFYSIYNKDNVREEIQRFREACCDGKMYPKPEGCSEELWSVIQKATKKNSADRYQSAVEMLADLQNVSEKQKQKTEQDNTLLTVGLLIESAILVGNFIGRKLDANNKIGKFYIEGTDNVYEGTMKNDLPHGKGTYTYQYGEVMRSISGKWKCVENEKIKFLGRKARYSGMVCNNHVNGWGELQISDLGVYRGSLKDGIFEMGYFRWESGEVFRGPWIYENGTILPHGMGWQQLTDGSVYEGSVIRGKKSGNGIMRYADGRVYNGEWQNDCYHGAGEYKDTNGKTVKGIWKDGNLIELL